MRYTKITEERLRKSFDKILEHVRVYDSELLAKDLMIRTEFLKMNFTKRQMNITVMIFTLSVSFGKEYALIPQLQDFEICGVSKTKIKPELDKLMDMKVIECKDGVLYRILPPAEWETPYHHGYRDERSRELFVLNAEHADIDFDFRGMDKG